MATLHEVMLRVNAEFKRAKRRKPRDKFDFGDPETVGLSVMRTDLTPISQRRDHDFGVYLGEQGGQYHVGTCEIIDWRPSKLESFGSLDRLKLRWCLD